MVLFLVSAFCVLFFTADKEVLPESIKIASENTSSPYQEKTAPEPKTIKTVLEVNDTRHESEIIDSISVYDFMDKLRNEGKINFSEKTYLGMGKLIISINDVKSNGQYTWIYYVNDKEAEVGVSNYKINPGDVVSWRYEKVHY